MTLPEVVFEEDQGAYYSQRDVDTHYEPGQSPPEAGLDEREHSDGEDERGEEVLSLVGDDEDERHEHQRDADRSPQLRHPAGVGLRLRDGARGVRYVGVRGGTLAISQAFGMTPLATRARTSSSDSCCAQRLDFSGELFDVPRLVLVELAQVGPVARGFGVHAERLQPAALLL